VVEILTLCLLIYVLSFLIPASSGSLFFFLLPLEKLIKGTGKREGNQAIDKRESQDSGKGEPGFREASKATCWVVSGALGLAHRSHVHVLCCLQMDLSLLQSHLNHTLWWKGVCSCRCYEAGHRVHVLYTEPADSLEYKMQTPGSRR
jgi:hypothetical protein